MLLICALNIIFRSYYGPTGIEYSMLRVPIGSSDFSTRSYTLDDVLYDKDLEHFSLSIEDYDTRASIDHYNRNCNDITT